MRSWAILVNTQWVQYVTVFIFTISNDIRMLKKTPASVRRWTKSKIFLINADVTVIRKKNKKNKKNVNSFTPNFFSFPNNGVIVSAGCFNRFYAFKYLQSPATLKNTLHDTNNNYAAFVKNEPIVKNAQWNDEIGTPERVARPEKPKKPKWRHQNH